MNQPLHVRDLMSHQMLTVSPEQEVRALRELILEERHRHLLVIDTEGVLRGIVSHRDLLAKEAQESRTGPATVAQVMTAPAITVESGTTLATAAQLMFERRLGCLPVLEEGALVGILTEADFVRHLGRK